jgi:hypothetical protein
LGKKVCKIPIDLLTLKPYLEKPLNPLAQEVVLCVTTDLSVKCAGFFSIPHNVILALQLVLLRVVMKTYSYEIKHRQWQVKSAKLLGFLPAI